MAAKKKSASNRQLSLAQASKRVAQLTRLGVRASIVPEASAGKFRITGSLGAKKKSSKAPAKKKAAKKAAKKRR